ncbi:MAG TPA: hypothetical protein VKB88_13995 [Bryobacteraceae bacterium]|nr:hypothetical protein [Bryobacteraceae bacterium]
MSLFLLLARHFFGRFFDNDIVSQTTDMRTNSVQAFGLAASPGIFLALYMMPTDVSYDHPFAGNWLLVIDCYLFVLYSMVVMGLVMVLEWDALFPDRKDYLVLTPLPLSNRSVFTAKAVALVVFLAAFAAGTNLLGMLLVPFIGTSNRGTVSVWQVGAAHATAVLAAGAFVALSIAALQGILINVLTGRAFRRVSPWVQMGAMVFIVVILFTTPMIWMLLRPLIAGRSPLAQWFPPFWFLGLYLDLLPGHPGGPLFHELALQAVRAIEIVAAISAATYLAGYGRHARRVMESIETAFDGPGLLRRTFDRAVNRWLLPHPLERASFHFISNTILRNARQRLFLAVYAGVAVAVALPSLVWVRSHPAPGALVDFTPAGFLTLPLALSFFAVTGLRAAFNFPAELRANWIFQTAESEDCAVHIRAVRKWVIVMALVPLTAALAPFEIWIRGWRPAVIHLTFALVLALVLLHLLLVWFRKIPFTCSYFPGKTSMAVMVLIYIAGFAAYVFWMGRVETRLMNSPAGLAIYYALGVLALLGLERLERQELSIDDVLIYEDQPDPVVRSLELS